MKKDRKLSDNIHDILNIYQQLKAEHEKEERQLLPELNEKELHRLRKIYATEEAKCIFEALQKAKHWLKVWFHYTVFIAIPWIDLDKKITFL